METTKTSTNTCSLPSSYTAEDREKRKKIKNGNERLRNSGESGLQETILASWYAFFQLHIRRVEPLIRSQIEFSFSEQICFTKQFFN